MCSSDLANAAWFYGMFKSVSGTFTLDPEHAADGKVEVKIDAASIDTRDDKRDQHVRGPDFLDAKQYPDVTFTSKKVQRDGDNWTIDGDLTMRGKTKPVTLKAQKTGEGEFMGKRVGIEATTTIKRSEFGMTYGLAQNALGDEIVLTLSVEGTQPKEKGKEKEPVK